MPFNHYAKIKRILQVAEPGWYVRRINKPTQAKNFKGEVRQFDHYYRIYDTQDRPIAYCKFQQIEMFAKIMNLDQYDIMIHEN